MLLQPVWARGLMYLVMISPLAMLLRLALQQRFCQIIWRLIKEGYGKSWVSLKVPFEFEDDEILNIYNGNPLIRYGLSHMNLIEKHSFFYLSSYLFHFPLFMFHFEKTSAWEKDYTLTHVVFSFFFSLILKGFARRMSTFISEIILVFSSTCFTYPNIWCYLFEINYTCSNCWVSIVLINCLFTILKSVVFRKFHIQLTLSELIKLPLDRLV